MDSRSPHFTGQEHKDRPHKTPGVSQEERECPWSNLTGRRSTGSEGYKSPGGRQYVEHYWEAMEMVADKGNKICHCGLSHSSGDILL